MNGGGDPRVVVLNGASAAGKSRLLAGIQRIAIESRVLPGLRILQRTTTRSPRTNESLSTENRYLTHAEFEREAQAGRLDLHWRRRISTNLEHRYGFSLAPELTTGGLLVLSANNYLDWRGHPILQSLRRRNRLMIVRIWASLETRLRRLRERKPPLSAPELSARIADVPADQLPPVDFVVPNDELFQATSEWELLRLFTLFCFPTRWCERAALLTPRAS